jgi:hypothetical protein
MFAGSDSARIGTGERVVMDLVGRCEILRVDTAAEAARFYDIARPAINALRPGDSGRTMV